jgi:hypothetical protein
MPISSLEFGAREFNNYIPTIQEGRKDSLKNIMCQLIAFNT